VRRACDSSTASATSMRVQTIVKARNGRAALHDRRDELPHQVVAEDRGGCALRGVARAVGGLEIFGRNRDRSEVLARLAQENRIGLVQPVDSRPLRAVDLRPLVAEAVAIVALWPGLFPPRPLCGRWRIRRSDTTSHPRPREDMACRRGSGHAGRTVPRRRARHEDRDRVVSPGRDDRSEPRRREVMAGPAWRGAGPIDGVPFMAG